MAVNKIYVCCIVILLNIPGLTKADFYYVNSFTGDDSADGSSGNPKRTIQAAIDVCTHGDTVIVANGVYTGIGNRNIDYAGKAITVRSENGPLYCIIDCRADQNNPQRAFTFENAENNESILDGFTITRGYGWGAGIFCLNSSPAIINCILTENTSAGKGGAVACDNAQPYIADCTITNNSALDGGAIYCYDSQLIIHNCTISHNQAAGIQLNGLGGAVCCEQNSTMTITQTLISGNRARFGAAVFCRDSNLTLINNVITGNRAENHGGAMYCDAGTASVTNCTLSDNYAQVYGGAFRAFSNSTVLIANSVLWANNISNIDERGSEIALGSASAVVVSYCDVRGGQNIIQRESDSVLTWDQTNIEDNSDDYERQDPLFARPGYWDPNGTSNNTNDDFWVDGDYRLLPLSPGIDRGSNAALLGYGLDFEENTRVVNGLIDIGAHETGLVITKMNVKAGKNRSTQPDPTDFFSLAGTLDASLQDFLNSSQMVVYVGPYFEPIALDLPLFKQVGEKPIFVYKRSIAKGEPGFITAMTFNLTKKTFSIVAKNIDLSGLEAPFDVALRIGDNYYRPAAVGEIKANGRKKPLPMTLMMGIDDTLRIHKQPKFKPSTPKKGPGHDYLLIQGGISLAYPPQDLAGKRVDITWGTYQDYIPADGWIPNKTGDRFIYKRRVSDLTPNAVVLAQFNFKKCTFKIVIKNADIGPLPAPQNLTVSFDGFLATARPPYLR